jgi:hypothetical protein
MKDFRTHFHAHYVKPQQSVVSGGSLALRLISTGANSVQDQEREIVGNSSSDGSTDDMIPSP